MEAGRMEWVNSIPTNECSSMNLALACPMSASLERLGPDILVVKHDVQWAPGYVENGVAELLLLDDGLYEVEYLAGQIVEDVEGLKLLEQTFVDAVEHEQLVVERLECLDEGLGRHAPEDQLDELDRYPQVIIRRGNVKMESGVRHFEV